MLPALDIAQEERGHLTPEDMTEVAGLLNLDPGYVQGVATFYTLLHLEPVGKHHFYVCTNLSCTLRGAPEVVEWLKRKTGAERPGQISEGGLFSWEEVECLGACEYAPMMRYAGRYHYDLTESRIDEILAEARADA